MGYSSTILNSYNDVPRFSHVAAMTSLIATMVNALLYLIGVTLGVFTGVTVPSAISGELTIGPIVIVSFATSSFGFLTFHVMSRSRPDSYAVFRNGTWALVAGSMLAPLAVDAWTWQQILFAQIMHFVVGASMLYGINRWRESHVNHR